MQPAVLSLLDRQNDETGAPKLEQGIAPPIGDVDEDETEAFEDSRRLGDYDFDMSDSEGGAAVYGPSSSNDVLLSDFDVDDGDEDEEDDGSGGEGEGGADDDGDEHGPNVNMNAHAPDLLDAELMMGAILDTISPSILGSENLGLFDFLGHWAERRQFFPNGQPRPWDLPRPNIRSILIQMEDAVGAVEYSHLLGDGCDLQGVNWRRMNLTRRAARERRRHEYRNYVNRPGSDKTSATTGGQMIPATDDFFRFKRMDMRRDVSVAHFQLRSVLACPSRNQAFYPSAQGVNVFNKSTLRTEVAMNLEEYPGMASPAISTLDAGFGVLMGGTFNGDYCLQSLTSEDRSSYSEGQISADIGGITNHISLYRPRRSHTPHAAIASNDHGFRVMDVQTETFVGEPRRYPFALNCSAVSPDGRLRALVGDCVDVLIANADTGETLQRLGGHRDYGFACAWSDDGHTVATGFQDKDVRIWDARRWCNSSGVAEPLRVIRAELAGVRNLRFSPAGSGRPVLVAVEEADYVSIIDARTFASKQTVDLFGEMGGVAFTNDGHELTVLCCDRHRGGLLQLERCGTMAEPWIRSSWDRQGEAEEARGWPRTFWANLEPF